MEHLKKSQTYCRHTCGTTVPVTSLGTFLFLQVIIRKTQPASRFAVVQTTLLMFGGSALFRRRIVFLPMKHAGVILLSGSNEMNLISCWRF